MRAAVLRGGGMVCRDDVVEPVPGPGQVLASVRACGICGSDLHFAKHADGVLSLTAKLEGMPKADVGVDLTSDVFMGHEFSAEVLEAGPDTERHRREHWSHRSPCCCRRRAWSRWSTPTRRSVGMPSGCCCRHRFCSSCPTGWTRGTPR